MKYNVTLSYHGSATFEVEAENGNEALEAARQKAYSMDKDSFLDAIELMEEDHDVEEIEEQEPAGGDEWKKPRFTARDLCEIKYDEDPYIRDVNDSTEVNSGRVVVDFECSVWTRDGRCLTVEAETRVLGYVNVNFRGKTYRKASSMPKELLDCYHNGVDPDTIDPDYCVSENNWFEDFLTISENDEVLREYDNVVDDPGSLNSFMDWAVDCLNESEKCLSYFFKDDDKVRWDDPDRSLPNRLTETELKEYRERVFDIIRFDDDRAVISDGVSEKEVRYSELLIK